MVSQMNGRRRKPTWQSAGLRGEVGARVRVRHNCRRVFVPLALLAVCVVQPPLAGHGQSVGLTISPYGTAGMGRNGGQAPFIGYGVAVELSGWFAPMRVQYMDVRVLRSCKISLPPKCNVDIPEGRTAVGSVPVRIIGTHGATLVLRPEAGVASWLDNARSRRFAQLYYGGALELQFEADHWRVWFDWGERRSSALGLRGGSIGIGIKAAIH
jgi:hypothetical protein